MRRTFFFIVAVCLATPLFASIARASALELSSPRFDPLPETRIRVSEDLASFERPAPSLLNRALRQAYEQPSTTNASGLAGFLSVDPGKDWDLRQPQSWNMYSYVRNRPLVLVDLNGRNAVLIRGKKGLRLAWDSDADGVADDLQQPPQPQKPASRSGPSFGGVTVTAAKGMGGSVTGGKNNGQGFVQARAGAGYGAGAKWDPTAKVPTPEDGSTPPRAFVGLSASVSLSVGPFGFDFTLRTGAVVYIAADGRTHIDASNTAGPKMTGKWKQGLGLGLSGLAGGEAGFTFDFFD